MKKIFFAFSFLLFFKVFAQPVFEGGTVLQVDKFNNYSSQIIFVNCSKMKSINIYFFVFEEKNKNWLDIGSINASRFGIKYYLIPKSRFKTASYIAYKTNLDNNTIIIDATEDRDPYLQVVDKNNTFIGHSIKFENIYANYHKGFYKIDTSKLEKNYEEYLKVINSPECIIMYNSPVTGVWEIYGTVSSYGELTAFFKKDIDGLPPTWIVQVMNCEKLYKITTSTRHDDLYFTFIQTSEIKEEIMEEVPAYISNDIETELIKLKKLYENNLIDESEYKAKKAKLLNL